jgi:hypothetical protein
MNEDFPITHYEYTMKHPVIKMDEHVNLIIKHLGKDPIDFKIFGDWFVQHTKTNSIMASLMSNYTMAANLLYHCWRMKCCDEKIFFINKNLIHMLANTTVNMKASDLMPPFEEFYLYLDQEDLTIQDMDRGPIKPVNGIYVNIRKDNCDGIRKMRLILTSGSVGIETGNDVNYFTQFQLIDNANLETCIQNMFDRINDGTMHIFDMSDINRDAMIKSFSLVANIILYISSKDSDIFPFKPKTIPLFKKSERKMKKAIQKSMRTCEKPIILVGYNFPDLATTDSHGKSFSISYCFDVRGYWKGQWKGSITNPGEIGNERRKEIIFVQPYKKGKDFVETINKKYIVQ